VLVGSFAALLLALILPPLVAPPARAQSPCDALVAPHLQAGATGRVTSPYGLSLKNQPMTGAAGAISGALTGVGVGTGVASWARAEPARANPRATRA